VLTEIKQTMRRFYDSASARYGERDEGVRQRFHNALELAWLDPLNFSGKSILDAGTGACRLPQYLTKRRQSHRLCCGVDLSYEMLRIAARRAPSGTVLLQCDAENLPFADASFNFIVCLGLFEYVADLRPFLREFFRVLAPAGQLLFTCRNRDRWSEFAGGNYPVAYHDSASILHAISGSGLELLQRATIYHLEGRWIWALARIARPLGADSRLVEFAIAANRFLQRTRCTAAHGKTHLVLAQRRQDRD
jgi:SAM-dependent methyltransferase